ncbi:MAG: hypothetical protein Q4F97_03685 [Bacteroidales bacterium]|nr:hypothetical protein [Bacteroidales bacterium]
MKTVSLICVAVLVISLFPIMSWLPSSEHWFTQVWKSIVCGGFLWLAWKDFRNKSLAVWNLALLMGAIYYNPIFSIEKEYSPTSTYITLFAILFLIVFAFKRNSILSE